METYSYDAFISYRQEYDKKIAKILHRNIEYYHIPSKLQKKYRKKKFRVFLDKEELRTTYDLNVDILEALKNSKYLIVVCSPATRKAPWILKEIEAFKKYHGDSVKNIITVLSDGKSKESIPDVLRENGYEPLAANYRIKQERSKELSRIIATLIGCEYDDLIDRRKKYEIKRAVFVSAVIAVFFIVLAVMGIINKINKNNSLLEKSKNLAFLSENAYNSHDTRGAIENALNALDKKYTPEAKRALLTSTEVYKTEEAEMGYLRSFKLNVPIKEYAVYEEGEGTYISILGKDTSLRVYNVKTGEKTMSVDFDQIGHNSNQDVHIIMCEENQLIFWASYNIISFNLDEVAVSWERKLEDDSSYKYTNLLYNSDDIVVGLNSGEILFLDKKDGELTDSIFLDESAAGEENGEQMLAAISTDSRYLLCHSQSYAYLYNMDEMTYYIVAKDIQSTEINGKIIGDYCLLSYLKGTEKDIHIVCYDIKNNMLVFEKETANVKKGFKGEKEYYIPWFMSFENRTVNGEIMNIAVSVLGNSMILIDERSGQIISEVQFTNRIKGLFMQKRSLRNHDYGIMSLGDGDGEDVLTAVFEDGKCADYSFTSTGISESYRTFDDGVIHLEKVKNYFCVSYKSKLSELREENVRYGLTRNIKTHESESFSDSILIYGERELNTGYQKVTDDYNYQSSVFSYEDGFLIFQPKSCIYYDIKKNSVVWENEDINIEDDTIYLNVSFDEDFYKMQNENSSYKFLGADVSGQYAIIGYFGKNFCYNIQFLNKSDGKIVKTDSLNLESFNDAPFKIQEICDFQKNGNKLFFSARLKETSGLIISYDMISGQYNCKIFPLINSSSYINIISISNDGKHVFWCEQNKDDKGNNNDILYLDNCFQSVILNMDSGKLYPLKLDDDVKKNILLIPSPCWSEDNQSMVIRSDNLVLFFSQTGDCEKTIEMSDYVFAGFCFFENILYIIGDANGTPMLFRYEKTGDQRDSSELTGRTGFGGNIFNIECIKSFDSEVIMILNPSEFFMGSSLMNDIGNQIHNAWIVDQATGKTVAYIWQGAAYNRDMDYIFANGGIIKRYTTEEIMNKARELLD